MYHKFECSFSAIKGKNHETFWIHFNIYIFVLWLTDHVNYILDAYWYRESSLKNQLSILNSIRENHYSITERRTSLKTKYKRIYFFTIEQSFISEFTLYWNSYLLHRIIDCVPWIAEKNYKQICWSRGAEGTGQQNLDWFYYMIYYLRKILYNTIRYMIY